MALMWATVVITSDAGPTRMLIRATTVRYVGPMWPNRNGEVAQRNKWATQGLSIGPLGTTSPAVSHTPGKQGHIWPTYRPYVTC